VCGIAQSTATRRSSFDATAGEDGGLVTQTLEATKQYLLDHGWEEEERRLFLLEQLHDPSTRRRIERLGIGPGSRCLEIGAGRGSVARWLAERVGPSGHVVATDLELTFLEDLAGPNLEAHRQDVLVDEPPGAPFDLIHCRAVLMHIPERRRALERMAGWLAPGGVLLCEEPDWAFALTSPSEIWTRTFRAFQEGLPTMDFACGRLLVEQLRQTGLEGVAAGAEVDLVQHGTDGAEWYRLSMLALEEPVLASGALTETEFELAYALFDDPEFCEPGFIFVGASGRAPAA
jgi:SAM-dependent methyltransferase